MINEINCLFQTKFRSAVKTSQRVVREIVEQDKEQIETILHSVNTIGKALDERYDEMQNLTVFCAKLQVPNVFGTIVAGAGDATLSVIEVRNFDKLLKLICVWF